MQATPAVAQATRALVQEMLAQCFAPFVARWRDASHTPAAVDYARLVLNGEPMGHLYGRSLTVVKAHAHTLPLPLQWTQSDAGVAVLQIEAPWDALNAALTDWGLALHTQGLVRGWRNEMQAAHNVQGVTRLILERGLFKLLGLCSQAVHMHIETPNGLVWMGQRALSKAENPGMLDNLAAGGLSAQENPLECALRELREEAGLHADEVDLQATGPLLRMNRSIQHGWHQETVYMFKGEVAAHWRPCNQDGEVAGFCLMTRRAAVNAVNQWRLTPDAALVTAWMLSQRPELLQE